MKFKLYYVQECSAKSIDAKEEFFVAKKEF